MQFIPKKIEILSVTSYFFIIIVKCYNKPNLKNLVRIDYFDEINFLEFLQAFFLAGYSSLHLILFYSRT